MDGATMVRGLIAGLAATGPMTLLELLARTRWGLEGLLDWQQNQATVVRITKGSIQSAVVPGLGLHFLHGLLAGIVFVVALPLFPPALPFWVLGPGYGVVLFALSLAVHKPLTGRAAWSGPLRGVALGVGLLSHVVYGAALALLVVWP